MKNSNFNKRDIMNKAWKFFKSHMGTFAECLKKAWSNAKAIKNALMNATEECHTWYGWKELGYEVIHESIALFKVVVADNTKNGTRILSYFGKSQVESVG